MIYYVAAALIIALGGLSIRLSSLSWARRPVWPREGHGRTYFAHYSDR